MQSGTGMFTDIKVTRIMRMLMVVLRAWRKSSQANSVGLA